MVLYNNITEHKGTLAIFSDSPPGGEMFGLGEPAYERIGDMTFWRVDAKRILYPWEAATRNFHDREMNLKRLLHDDYGLDMQPMYSPGERNNPSSGRRYFVGGHVRMAFNEQRLRDDELHEHLQEFPWLNANNIKIATPPRESYVQSLRVWAPEDFKDVGDLVWSSLEGLVDSYRLPHRTDVKELIAVPSR